NPEDWLWATWRDRNFLPMPEVKPFDKEEALAKLQQIFIEKHGSRLSERWRRSQIPLLLSPEEAHFWFVGLNTGLKNKSSLRNVATTNKDTQELIDSLRAKKFTGEIGVEEIVATLISSKTSVDWYPIEIAIALLNLDKFDLVISSLVDISLFDDDELFKYIDTQCDIKNFGHPKHHRRYKSTREAFDRLVDLIRKSISNLIMSLITALGIHYLRYKNQAEVEKIRNKLLPVIDKLPLVLKSINASLSKYDLVSVYVCFRMYDRVLASVEKLPDKSSRVRASFSSIYGLSSGELVSYHARRLKLHLTNPILIRGWLAHTEYDALDWVRESIIKAGKKKQAIELFEVLALVNAPETAPEMLALIESSKAPELARQWLLDNPKCTVVGLVNAAKGDSKLAKNAIAFLKSFKQHEDLIAEYIREVPPQLAQKITEEVLNYSESKDLYFSDRNLPEWFKVNVTKSKTSKSKKPSFLREYHSTWLILGELPPLQVGQHCFTSEQIKLILQASSQSTLNSPHPLIKELKTYVKSDILDAFIWRVFELWLNDGGSAKEKWAIYILGLLGSDEIAIKLTPYIKRWPRESFHQRAVWGLECLRKIGTDTALMQIHHVSQKVKFGALKGTAKDCLDSIARKRNLTFQQLEDRIIPSCGLDKQGNRVFDFGDRQFSFVLGEGIKPKVRGNDGKVRANVPKAAKKDNPELADKAIADWKLVKKQVSQTVKVQAVRLEMAMCDKRRWDKQEFESLLVNHSLMTHLVQQFVWAVF
ncbi:MAG: DUF4132 domain-containing protein, partial [Cyanobacteria bacterium P01_A01_bin.83]